LWGIAQHFYGNGALWTQIYNANKGVIGANPNLIHTGAVLTIPAKAA
jgi:nucleoid-associated protein YgaU